MGSVHVDTNPGETVLFQGLLAEFGESVVTRQRLDIADVRISTPSGTILIERKSWMDFVSSLRDGRYANQKLRLLAERERAVAAGERLDVIVLIENKVTPFYNGETRGMRHNQPFAALAKMAIRDGIAVVYSANAEDSAQHVAYVYKTALKDGFNAAEKARTVVASGYAGTAKHTNKRKNADDAAFEMMLTTISGVSGAKAKAVADEYQSLANLVRAYDRLKAAGGTEDELSEMLADIECGGKRLGPSVSLKIRTALFS